MANENASTRAKVPITRFLLGGLAAGLISAVLNNLYSLAYTAATDISVPEVIHFGSISGASVAPALIGALIYFALSRFTNRATLLFVVGGLVFMLVSCAGPLIGEIPDGSVTQAGFMGLTVPMHLIAGFVCVLIVPRLTRG